MKRYLFLALLPLLFSGCWTARIVTVAPDPINVSSYSTQVTVPKAHMVTTTRVNAVDNDISLYLDLQAIGAAFAQSSNVQEFENLINNSSYMLSNLDLNRDGYVDYLRVMETIQGYAHVFVIQAVLAQNVYQDVATVVAEVPSVSTCHIQIVGDPFIYGPRFILEPVFLIRPLICSYLLRPSYVPWRSPWYWNHFPSHYKRPVPIYIGLYHAYVDTYLRNHRYCNHVNYVEAYHFADYLRISAPDRRNDYGRQHPERDFVTRTSSYSSTRSSGSNPVVNARNIREAYEADNITTTTSTTRRASSTATPRSDSNAKAVTSTRSASTSTPRTVTASATAVSTRSSNANGSSTTASRSTGTASSSTGSRSATTSTSGRSTATSGTSARSTSASTGTSTRSASVNTSTPRSASTMVKSNVRSSGSSNTSIRTVSPTGKETTTNRSSSANTRSSSASPTGGRSTTVSSSSNRSSSTTATPRSSSTSASSTGRSSGSVSTGRR